MKQVLAALGLLLFILPAGLASAQGQEAAESSAIDPIMVSATREERDLMAVPMSVTVVYSKAIEERYPGANTAVKFMDVPGVSFPTGRGAPGNNLMVSIRGQRPWRVLYLIDGMRVSSVFREDINKGLLTVDPTDIERVEIIKGPASSLYGSEAIGGVVNIITRKGGGEGRPIGGRFDLTYDGSTSGFQPHVAVYGDPGDWWYRVSASYQKAGDRRMAELGRADHSSFTTESLFGSLGHDFGWGFAELTFNHYDSDVEEMTYRYSMDERTAKYYPIEHDQITELGVFPKNRRDSVSGKLVFRNPLPHLDLLTLRAYHQDRDSYEAGYYKSNGLLNVGRGEVVKNFGAAVQADFSFGPHELIAGFEYLHDDLEARTQSEWSEPILITEATETTGAAYVQDTWHIFGPLTLIAGLRHTWTSIELSRFDEIPERATSLKFKNLVGNAGLVYAPLDTLSLRLQYSQGFRTPDLASKLTGTGEYLLPNYDLQPETSENWEFGVRYNDGSLFVDATVYHNKVDDFIKSWNLGWYNGHLLSTMVNAANYDVTGFELGVSWRIGGTGLTPYGSYSYLDGTVDYGDSSTKNVAAPRSWGTIGLRYDRPFGEDGNFYADATARISSNFLEILQSGFVMYRSKSGNTVDFSVGAEWGEPRIKIVASLKNVLDREFQPAYYGYPARHFVLSASVLF